MGLCFPFMLFYPSFICGVILCFFLFVIASMSHPRISIA
uniref:Uncharacterized protein n=1 Tax=Rhizophora mucronata TaxID=61149 RepID=A0A2P2M655_RHIMU